MISLVLNVSTIPDLRNLTNGFMMVILFYRKGKLFFVSSTTITSTLKTSTVCLTHQSPAAAAAATSCQNPSSPPGSRAKMCGPGCRCVPGTPGTFCAPFCGTGRNPPCAAGCFCRPSCGTAAVTIPPPGPCVIGSPLTPGCTCPPGCGSRGDCPPGCACRANCGQTSGTGPCWRDCIAPCAPGCNPLLSGDQPMEPCTSCTATNPLLPAVLPNDMFLRIPTCTGRKRKRAITDSMMVADGLKISPSPPSLPDIER